MRLDPDFQLNILDVRASRRERCAGSLRSAGRSLIEMLVALSIGSVVLGAVLVAVSGSGLTGGKQGAQGQLSENGQIALNLLANHLRMSGFWLPTSLSVSMDRPTGPMLIGCRNGFVDPTSAWGSLACVGGAPSTGRDAVAVRFNANEGGAAAPLDCLGRNIAALGGEVDDRFYIEAAAATTTGNPALYCKGVGNAVAQMLMDNVEAMSLQYGISAVVPVDDTTVQAFDPPAFGGETVRYMTADALSTACPVTGAMPANSWCAVSSIRICILMRSTDDTVDNVSTPYIDCDGVQRSQADRRLRRALSTTVSIRNRTASLPVTGP
jgi:type IV pilus assembly protein PilW